MLRINITSVYVDDQQRALDFYTQKLGFVVKYDVPAGGARWITVVSPADTEGTELLLEPVGFATAKAFKEELYDSGVPFTQFAVDDVNAEYERLSAAGVRFTQQPVDAGHVSFAVLDDTCGNLIQIIHQHGEPPAA